jgi:hypothetical protein
MNPRSESPLTPQGHSADGDKLDSLLSSFFQAQVPRTWPETKSVTEPSSPLSDRFARGRFPFRSRLVLAASLVLLLLAQVLFSSTFTGLGRVRPDREAGPNFGTKLGPDGEMRLKHASPRLSK